MSTPNYAPPPSAFPGVKKGGHQPSGPKPEERKTPTPPCLVCTGCNTVFNLDTEHNNRTYRGILMEVHKLRDNEPHPIFYYDK